MARKARVSRQPSALSDLLSRLSRLFQPKSPFSAIFTPTSPPYERDYYYYRVFLSIYQGLRKKQRVTKLSLVSDFVFSLYLLEAHFREIYGINSAVNNPLLLPK